MKLKFSEKEEEEKNKPKFVIMDKYQYKDYVKKKEIKARDSISVNGSVSCREHRPGGSSQSKINVKVSASATPIVNDFSTKKTTSRDNLKNYSDFNKNRKEVASITFDYCKSNQKFMMTSASSFSPKISFQPTYPSTRISSAKTDGTNRFRRFHVKKN